MRRLISSDWQLDSNPRDRYRTDFMVKSLPTLIDKYKPDQFLFLGDLTEIKDGHAAPLVNEIVDTFYSLSKKCEIIILEGNHDYLHEGHPYFEFLSNIDNVSWISKPTVRDNCLFLPHTRAYKKEWTGVKFDGFDFLFAHNIFEGVKANGQLLSGISTKIFPDDATVISGDVHEPQELDGGKIIYVGSPFTTDFGDNYQGRVLLLDDLNIKSIKVYGQQKRLINIDWQAGGMARAAQSANENDLVKVNVHLGMQHVAEWAAIREEVEAWAIKNKFIVNSIIPIVEVAYDKTARIKNVQSSKKSDLQYLSNFASRAGIDEQTADIGKQILEQET